MTDRPARDAAAVRVIPPLVPIAAILTGILLSKVWPLPTGLDVYAPFLARIGEGIIVAAIAMVFWVGLLMLRSGQNPSPETPTPTLLERGPFRFSRNPIYLMMVVICLGFAIRRLDLWILLLTPLAAWALQRFVILPEERYLEGKFGDEYRAYMNRVRRWL